MICLFNVEINLFNAIILSIEHMFVGGDLYQIMSL